MRRVLYGIAVASLGLTLVLITRAQAQDDEAFILYRQKVMASNGAHSGAIGDILKNKLAYQSLHIVNHAKAINLNSALIEEAFKKEVTDGKTDAKPDIWKDRDKFVAAAKALGEESAKLAEVAQSGNMEAIDAQVKKLSESCTGCHRSFRKPREESYRQQR